MVCQLAAQCGCTHRKGSAGSPPPGEPLQGDLVGFLRFVAVFQDGIDNIVSHRQALFFPVWEKVSVEDIEGFMTVLRTVVETLGDRVTYLEHLNRPW